LHQERADTSLRSFLIAARPQRSQAAERCPRARAADPDILASGIRGYRRQRRRAQLKRALIVATLAVAFCGSAFLVSDNHSARSTVATRVAPDNLDPEVTGSIGGVAPTPSAGRTVVNAGG